MSSTVTLHARCHCRHASFTYTLPASSFPLKSSICHCRSCRHATGQVFATFAVIPSPHRPDVSNLRSYASSKTLTRYFCPKCGASVANFEEEEWDLATGMIEVECERPLGSLDGLLNRVQLFVGDTEDGGGSVWMSGNWDGRRWRRHREQEAITDELLQEMQKRSHNEQTSIIDNVLEANCHCGSIKIAVKRPDHGGKYRAVLDSCDSCRKASGFEITSWASLDPMKVSINDQGLYLADPGLGHYSTSKGVDRYFCQNCGAKVFYYQPGKTDQREIDLSIGVINSLHGVRAEDWLEWDKGEKFVCFKEDASDDRFVKSLINGENQVSTN